MLSFMATLVQLASSGAVGVIAAPFIVLAFLFHVCALWRCWASTRTCAAYQATLRAQLRSDVALSARDDAMAARAGVPVGCEHCAASARLPERDTDALAELWVPSARALETRATSVARSRRT